MSNFFKNKIDLLLPHDKYKYIVSDRYQLKWEIIQYFITKHSTGAWFKILDIGCGYPNLLSSFKTGYRKVKIKKYIGIDIRSNVIDYLKKKYPDNEWILSNFMENIDFAKNEFNVLAILGPELPIAKFSKLVKQYIPFLELGGLFIVDNSPGPRPLTIKKRLGKILMRKFEILEGCSLEINHIPKKLHPEFPNVYKRTITVLRKK
jgi:ubiquinone/menaquinone biosynthesis C-methylase UbiE